ncbi:MAG TPA: class I SAM-dependent methyltransferase [Thermoanaerobaculia bacterium]|nr:class I SAM-dependent methyltransferase [Thermoanaerobaculia bacterium]
MSDLRRSVWLPSEALRRHANRTATGSADVDWLTHVRRRHFTVAPRRVLVLGAGEGHLEVALAPHFPEAEIAGVDSDAAAIGRARNRAARRGLSRVVHEVRDPGRDPLPPGPWDAVFAREVLHRITEPERLLRAVHDALAPGGRVVLSDYVGPSDPDAVPAWRDAIRRYVRVLPIGLRFDPESGLPFARDLRSSDGGPDAAPLLETARAIFVPEGFYRGGGALIQPLLAPGVARNLRPEGLDERLLGFLGDAEDDLRARGLVDDVFAIFVGRRRADTRVT